MLKALHGGEDDSEQQKRNIDPFLVFPSVQTLLLKETGLGIEGCQSLVKTEVGLNVVSTALMQGLRQRGLTANDIKMTTSEAKSKSGSSTRLMRLTALLRSGDGAEPALGSSTSATKETSEAKSVAKAFAKIAKNKAGAGGGMSEERARSILTSSDVKLFSKIAANGRPEGHAKSLSR